MIDPVRLAFPARYTDAPVGILDLVGNTPLVHLATLSRQAGVPVYAKAEWTNPGGSVKDRAARHILADAVRRGELGPTRPGRRLIDATSGNTGIAYATLAPAFGVPVTLTMPASASRERRVILSGLGVELILTDAALGSDGAIEEAARRAHDEPHRYHHVDQYANDANWRAHHETTAPEIWRQSWGRVTHFVAGLGTTGTLVGTARYLRERRSDVRIVAVGPDRPDHGLDGLKHLETAIVPAIWDAHAPDEVFQVPTDAALGMVRRLAQEEGLLLGPSGGAAAIAALHVARDAANAIGRAPARRDASAPSIQNTRHDTPVVVTLFPDNASKYLSTPFWGQGL